VNKEALLLTATGKQDAATRAHTYLRLEDRSRERRSTGRRWIVVEDAVTEAPMDKGETTHRAGPARYRSR